MSENSSSFKFFSPLTTPTVARCKFAQQQKGADVICNFSSDSDNSSIFITQSKTKRSKVIKQSKRQVIESIITSLDSVNSDSGSENLFAPNMTVTVHGKKKTKSTMRLTPDFINSDLSDAYSDCEMPSSVNNLNIKSSAGSRMPTKKETSSNHGNSSSSDLLTSDSESDNSSKSVEHSARGKSELNISSGRRKKSSRSSSESDSISGESVDSVIGSEVGPNLTSNERKTSKLSGTNHATSYKHQNSSSDLTSGSESGSDEQKGSKKPQKKQELRRMFSSSLLSSSDFESESDFDLDDKKSKPGSTKVKISSIVQTSITASTDGSQNSSLKGKQLSSSKRGVYSASGSGSKSLLISTDSNSDTSPVIPKQNIQRLVTKSQEDQSTVVATASPSNEAEAGRNKSTDYRKKVKRFECPQGFEEVDNIGATVLPIRKSAHKEFWLIKTPWDNARFPYILAYKSGLTANNIDLDPRCIMLWQIKFDISKLDRATISLGGSIRLPGTEDTKHFDVMAIPKSKEDVLKMGTLLANENLDSLLYGPSLAGQIHVMESYASIPLVEIQALPTTRHQIPLDLKQRHVPFGAKSPVRTMETDEMAGEKRGKKRKGEEMEIRKKKKKKKTKG